MTYERLANGFVQRALLIEGTSHSLVLRAGNVRRERTGVHAAITIGLDSVILEEDSFNVDRREDRTRLANAALKSPLIEDLAPRLKPILDHELLLFLRGLWDFEVGKDAPVRRGGGLVRRAPLYLLRPYLLQQAGTILFAGPGLGKSWTAYMLAVMVDAGYEFFYEARQQPVLVVNLERSAESVDTRLSDINAALGQARERPLLRLDKRGRKFSDVADAVLRTVEAEGVGLVVLDSLSRAGYGDLNANEDANRSMDALNALGCGWLALGHTARGDDTHVFGSQMFDAAADITVQLLSEERIDQFGKSILGIGLKGMKANDIRRPPLTVLAYEFDELGLTGVRKARRGEFLTIENASAALDVRGQVTAYLQAEGEASATAIARDTGIARSTVATLLHNGPEYVGARRGKAVFYHVAEPDVSETTRFDTSDTTPEMIVSSERRSIRRQHDDPTQEAVVEELSKPVEFDSYPFPDDPGRIDSLAGL